MDAGTTLGPYEVIGSLGAGAMGEVYRTHHAKLDRDVAIKVLRRIFGDDRERRVRFEREARALASLNHPRRNGGRDRVALRTYDGVGGFTQIDNLKGATMTVHVQLRASRRADDIQKRIEAR